MGHFKTFDACFMSSIEVLYELKHSFDYIIASPTEILATGFPYKEILPELLNDKPNYERIAGKYIEQYNDKRGIQKSASITVVKTSALNSFSEALKELVCQDAFTFDTNAILQYDQESTYWLFDLENFISLFKDTDQKKL